MKQTVTIGELQRLFLEMMNEFHRFCVDKNIKYYMVGGTLLGAVREKGFIPWDDDVDFAMPRPDYERFIREYDGDMILQSIRNDKKHFFPYVKLFNPDVQVIQIEDEKYQINSRVFVKFDIYPIDGLGNDKEKALSVLETVRRRNKLLYLNLTREKSKNPIKNVALAAIRCIPSRLILKNIDKKMSRYSTEDSLYLTRWREGGVSANLVDRDVFGEPALLPFEDYQFYAPQDYNEYLMKVYGDYMVEQRENAGLRHDIYQNKVTEELAKSLDCEQSVNAGGG